MHRFYLPPEQCQQHTLVLTDGEAHHALHVLRLRRGERVTVLDGQGREFLCDVQECQRAQVSLRVEEQRSVPPLPYHITLLQAVPKGKLIDSIIQKATELGAYRVVPLLSERVVTQLDEREAAHKAEKWQGVAIEAIKQCGSAWLPRVEPPLTLQQCLARKEPFDLPLIASLQNDTKHPRDYFRAFEQAHGRKPQTLAVWIGPEGDFTPAEVQAILSAGSHPITLGRLVLRTETAAVYCLSVLNYELQSPAA
ncbi:MAG TPA: 16S rRNA (uracil(1498)-N(3))-methyltransferase [Bacillota bacterium]|nr:16S rRNA (uracil(1498)-N(3))-methyltransferase [Bacillota bacterium]